MNLEKDFDQLYGFDKNKRVRTWKAQVFSDENDFGIIKISHGLLNGQLQTETRTINIGKNIGKKNETTPIIQAINETEKRWKDKIEKEGYLTNLDSLSTTDVTTIQDKYLPMLAQTFSLTGGKKSSAELPFFVQPKLDGLRCLIFKQENGNIVTQSRTGKLFIHLSHITNELKTFFAKNPNIILDGELFTFDFPFEKLAGLIKKEKISETDKINLTNIKFHNYDFFDINNLDMTYKNRQNFLYRKIKSKFTHTIYVDTQLVDNMDDFKEIFSKYIEDGYEGIMIRKVNGKYNIGNRSNDLLKYKEFMESEFEIVGFTEGTGRDSGTIIWKCITPEGKTFNVRPEGSIEHRKTLFTNGDSYIGKQLTVKYQELSEEKVPRFPVGKDVRIDY